MLPTMIRSAPPAAADFAIRPELQPAPMMGPARGDLLAQGARGSPVRVKGLQLFTTRAPLRGAAGADELEHGIGRGSREPLIVDVVGQDVRPGCRPAARRAVRSPRPRSAGSSAKTPPGLSSAEKPRPGTRTRTGPRGSVELPGHPCADLARSRRQRCGSAARSAGARSARDPRSARESARSTLMTSMAPGTTTCAMPAAPAASSRRGACGAEAARELVGDLARRPVDDRLERALARESLHRLAAGAVRVEHDDLAARVREEAADVIAALRRHPEHRQRDRRAARGAASASTPSAMPHTAAAAFASTGASSRLTPAMSTTLGITMMSLRRVASAERRHEAASESRGGAQPAPRSRSRFPCRRRSRRRRAPSRRRRGAATSWAAPRATTSMASARGSSASASGRRAGRAGDVLASDVRMRLTRLAAG